MGKLTIYKVGFSLEDNYKVDDIETYLGSLKSTDVTFDTDKLNYLSLSQTIDIRLKVDQKYQTVALGNYARLVQDGQIYYYFLTDAELIGKNVLAFNLMLDTINTFADNIKNSWSDRTLITRQHKDRYSYANGKYWKQIDYYNEELNPVLDNYSDYIKLYIDGKGGTTYSEGCVDPVLVYINNPALSSETTANEAIKVGLTWQSNYAGLPAVSNSGKTITAYPNTMYFVTDSGCGNNPYVSIKTASGEKLELDIAGTGDDADAVRRMVAFYFAWNSVSQNYVLYAKKFYYTGSSYPYSYKSTNDDWYSWTSTSNATITLFLNNIRQYTSLAYTEFNKTITGLDAVDLNKNRVLIESGTLPVLYPTKSHALDLTNSKFSKAVYLGNNAAPIKYTVSNGCAYITNFTFVPGYNIWIWNRYDDVTSTTTFTNRYISASYVPISLSELNGSTTISPAKKQAYNWQYETKLYASEFYQPTAVLDGNTTAIYQLEKILPSYAEDVSLKITKYASVNMDDDVCYKSALASGGVLIKNTPNSDITVGQLQEVPLQTSSYLEYIRNGFNYDNQQYKIKERNNKIQIAAQLIGSAAQVGLGAAGIGATYLSALQTKNSLVQLAEQRIQGVNAQITANYKGFKSHRSRSRQHLPGDYTAEEWNAEQREYYAAWKQAERALPAAQQELEAAKAVKPSTGALAQATQNVGSLNVSQGINSGASAVTSILAISDNQQAWQSSQAKLRYANTVNYQETNIALGSVSLGTESYYYTALPKEEIRKHIADTFNWTGYACAEQGIPDTDTRTYRNFLQCTAFFSDSKLNIYSAYVDDIKQRYQAGVTYVHNVDNTWDFEGQYENWETNLLN